MHNDIADIKATQVRLGRDVRSTEEKLAAKETRLTRQENEVQMNERFQRGFNLFFSGLEEKPGENVRELSTDLMFTNLKLKNNNRKMPHVAQRDPKFFFKVGKF